MILQAVQGKPPNKATGRVGAVGQIHLICTTVFKFNERHEKITNCIQRDV